VRLSIKRCSEQDVLCLCALAPNLNSLRIHDFSSDDGDDDSNDANFNAILALINRSVHLTKLHITSNVHDVVNLNSLERLIRIYQSSLEQVTLHIGQSHQIHESQLQRIFEPCQRLIKLAFVFVYYNEEVNLVDELRQFQNEWWLDNRRPPVLLLRNGNNGIFIVTMPCDYPFSLQISSDIHACRLNKGGFDSPLIRFTTVRRIDILNESNQLITFDWVGFIGRIFCAKDQMLCFSSWGFDSSYLLLEQVNFVSFIYSLILMKEKQKVVESAVQITTFMVKIAI